MQRDVRKLAGRGWFVDVQPAYEQAPNGRIVIFKVVERPVVRYVEYLGNYGLRTKKLAKETDLKVGGPVDPYAVQEARRRLVDLYHRNGFNNAQVSILEGDKPTDHGIVFVINEGTGPKNLEGRVRRQRVRQQPAGSRPRSIPSRRSRTSSKATSIANKSTPTSTSSPLTTARSATSTPRSAGSSSSTKRTNG